MFSKFATDPAPNHFNGEDVIGQELFGYSNPQQRNGIPNQLKNKLQQWQYVNQPQESADDPEVEEYNYQQPLQVTYKKENQESEVIVKNIKINLEINLKINVV